MRSVEETTTLDRRVTWVKEHWRLFFSEMPLREKNFRSATQALDTKAALHKDHMNLNAYRKKTFNIFDNY